MYCMSERQRLLILLRCAGSPVPLLFTYVISTFFPWAGSFLQNWEWNILFVENLRLILYFVVYSFISHPVTLKGKRPASSKPMSRQEHQTSKDSSPRLAPQVVNELKSETGIHPVRHVASHNQQRTSTGVRHVARHVSGDGHYGNTGRSSLEKEDGARPDLVRHVAIRSPPDEDR